MASFLKEHKKLIFFSFILVLIIISAIVLKLFEIPANIPKPKSVKTYAVSRFSSNNEQSIQEASVLSGKGIPEGDVEIILSPNGAKGETKTDNEGIWKFSVPESVNPGKYNLTVILRDKSGNFASIKTYPVAIRENAQETGSLINFPFSEVYAQSRGKFYPNSSNIPPTTDENECWGVTIVNDPGGFRRQAATLCYRVQIQRNIFGQNPECKINTSSLLPMSVCEEARGEQVIAQEQPRELEALSAEYNGWVSKMHKLGVYPAKDIRTGEIVFVSREDFEAEVCNGRRCTQSPDYDKFIDGVANNNIEYIIGLGNELRKDCFSFAALRPFFPDAQEFFDPEKYVSLAYLYQPFCLDKDIKRSIEEDELYGYLVRAANNYVLDREDPFRDLVIASDGLFGTGAILKLFAMTEGYNTNGEDVINGGFAIAGILPPGKIAQAGKLAYIGARRVNPRTFLKVKQLSPEMASLRQALRGGARVPQEVLETVVERNLEDINV